MRRGTTAILVAALVLAGCADDNDGEGTRVESATEVQPADPADLAIAESALLALSDFPSGWSEVPSSDGDGGFSDEVSDARLELAACFGSETDSVLDFAMANADTGVFTSPDEHTVTNDVAIADQAEAEAFVDRFGGDGVPECITEAAAKVIEISLSEAAGDVPDDASLGAVTVGRLNLTPVGDELVAYRTTVPVSFGGFEVEFYSDQIAVRVGRGITALEIQSRVFPMDASEIEGYVAIAANRLAVAL